MKSSAAKKPRQQLSAFGAYFRHELKKNRRGMIIILLILVLAAGLVVFIIEPISDEDGKRKSPVIQFAFSLIDEDQSIIGEVLTESFLKTKYISAIYDDDLPTALRRLDDGETAMAMRIPSNLFEDVQHGSVQPVDIWLSPIMKTDVARFSSLIRQYALSLNLIHSTAFGFQRVYLNLTGDEDASWKETSRHAVDTITSLIERDSFLTEDSEPPFRLFAHASAGIMILVALLPGIVILVQTSRLNNTALEDRILLSCGSTIPIISRLLTGFIWWLVLSVPPLITMKIMASHLTIYPAAIVLVGIFLAMSMAMIALGRAEIPTVTVFQLGWGIFFALVLTGGILYPTVLFPDWLRTAFSFSPLYYAMRVVYRTVMAVQVTTGDVLLALWPLPPALLLCVIKGRRRV